MANVERFPKMRGVTPKATAGFSKFIYERDTKFGTPGKYKAILVLDPSDAEQREFIKERQARHEKAGGQPKNCPVKKGDPSVSKYQEEDLYYAQFKTSKAPVVVDGMKQNITDTEVRVFGGDTIRISYTDNPNSPTPGCFLYLNRVQLVQKNSGADADFDVVEDGYSADAATLSSSWESKPKEEPKEEYGDEDF